MKYAEFLEGLAPVILGMERGSFSLNRATFWDETKSGRRLLSSTYTLADVSEDYFDVEATFVLAFQWPESDGPVTQPLRIECVFRGHFHTSGPVDRDHAKTFAETESWLIFWPFFRQFVSDTTARMAIPPVVIPLALGPGQYSHERASKAVEQRTHKRKRITRGKRSEKA